MALYDISQPLRPALPVWPGDTAFTVARTWDHGETPVAVSRFAMSTHGGTHADAPLHYDASGIAIDEVPLDVYIGPARLIDLRGIGSVVDPDHLAPYLQSCPPRILLRTYARFPHDCWERDFTTVSAAAIEMLSAAGVRLIGIDSPSLDPETSKTMDAHHTVRCAAMHILEGLVLDDVPPGDYELIALPLRLAGLDASPVRAILRT